MGVKANKWGWEHEVEVRTTGVKTDLESMEGYWVQPQKLSVDVMQEIMALNKIHVDVEDKETVSEEDYKKVEEKVREKVKEMKKSGKTILDGDFVDMTKVAFLNGVKDHNFYNPKLLKNPDGSFQRDEDGDLLAEEDKDGKPVMEKSPWNEETYNRLARYYDAVLEIFTIVMRFNSPAKKKTSEKSATSPRGSIKK